MKKYLAAAVVAVMVFAFAAFAASLELDAGTLAFGQDDVGDCGGVADITYSHHQEDDFAYVDAIIVTFPQAAGECDGFGVWVRSEGVGAAVAEIGAQETDRAVVIVQDDGASQSVSGDNDWDVGNVLGGDRFGVPIEDLDDVSVKVWSDISHEGPGQFNTGQETPGGFSSGALLGLPQ